MQSFLEPTICKEDTEIEGGDPVFFNNSNESLDIPLEILSESRGRLTISELKTVLLGGHEDTRNTIHRPGSAYSEDHGYRTHPIMSPIEPSDDYQQHTWLTRRSQSPVNTNAGPAISAQETEDRLAALGVTGAPKPVHAPARPYPTSSSHVPVSDSPLTPSYKNDQRNSYAPEKDSSSRSRSPQRANM